MVEVRPQGHAGMSPANASVRRISHRLKVGVGSMPSACFIPWNPT